VFKPVGIPARELEWCELALDEYEVLRLCDALGMDQAIAAQQMAVSRPTLGRILERARHKVATFLTTGQGLHILGGPVLLHAGCGCCNHWDECGAGHHGSRPETGVAPRGETMERMTELRAKPGRVAVPSIAPGGLDATAAPHFGHCTCFTVVDIAEGAMHQAAIIDKPEHCGCQASVSLLKAHGVQALLCGRLGRQPYNACCESGILVLDTVAPTVAAALAAYANDELLPVGEEALCTTHSGAHGHHHGPQDASNPGMQEKQGQGRCGRH
jgi:predicted DNA-binding protein (UPF0251 family)/predicted Fe-Mo cluster-binding NifX family protein